MRIPHRLALLRRLLVDVRRANHRICVNSRGLLGVGDAIEATLGVICSPGAGATRASEHRPADLRLDWPWMVSSNRRQKISSELGSRAAREHEAELVDVIVELRPAGHDTPSAAAARASFEHDAEPVVSTIAQLGGEVTGRAWLNRTLRARVPPGRLAELSDHTQISTLDIPRAIRPD
jgi:hypothetical protein